MSTASYFKDEAGVHLSLHLAPAEYDILIAGLGSMYADDVRRLLLRAQKLHETREDTGPGGSRDIMARFDDVPPLGGA